MERGAKQRELGREGELIPEELCSSRGDLPERWTEWPREAARQETLQGQVRRRGSVNSSSHPLRQDILSSGQLFVSGVVDSHFYTEESHTGRVVVPGRELSLELH